MFHANTEPNTGDTQARLLHNLAIETLGSTATPILEKGTSLPTQNVQVFSTGADNQRQVEVHLLYGGGDAVINNASLGRFILKDIPPAPRGIPQIEVTVSVDAQHQLTVTARDRKTGRAEALGQSINLLEREVPPYDELHRPHVKPTTQSMSDFNAIFEEFFGGIARSPSSSAPKQIDISVELKVTFQEAALGAKKTLDIKRRSLCTVCGGSGAQAGTQRHQCEKCNGTGEIRETKTTFLGAMVTVQPCPRCKGKGSLTGSSCAQCRGEGQLLESKQITVKVPARVVTGNVMRIAGEANHTADGKSRGNVMLVVQVEPHPLLTLMGNDIHYTLKLNKDQAAHGGTFNVPTLEGTTAVQIPPNTPDGKVIVVTGLGALLKEGSPERGDQHINVKLTRMFGLF
ncbi:MAG: Hsp70 family protein [Anaerolineae bacterium]|nr:Hsp70 family protein [Anaerolineae bacterium]